MSDPITPLRAAETARAEQATAQEGYVRRVLVAADQDLATDMGDPVPDETISAWTAREAEHGTGVARVIGGAVSRVLDVFQRDHGAEAEAGDYERAAEVQQAELQAGDIAPHG